MAVPKRRTGKSRRDRRRSHLRLSGPTLGTCPNCGGQTVPHRMCPNCGYYKGRFVRAVKSS